LSKLGLRLRGRGVVVVVVVVVVGVVGVVGVVVVVVVVVVSVGVPLPELSNCHMHCAVTEGVFLRRNLYPAKPGYAFRR